MTDISYKTPPNTQGYIVTKSKWVKDNEIITLPNNILASPARFVQIISHLDSVKREDIYSYWFKKYGVNDESVSDVIAYAKWQAFAAIDFRVDAYKMMEFYDKGIFIQER